MILNEIENYLKSKITGHRNYVIPKLWVESHNEIYRDIVEEKEGKIFVEPYEFFSKSISYILEKSENKDYNKSIGILNGENNPEWIKKSIIFVPINPDPPVTIIFMEVN